MPIGGRRLGAGVRPLSAAALVVLLLVLVAALLPDGFALSRRAEPLRVVAPDIPALAGYLVVAIAAVMLLAWAALQLTGMRAGTRRRERRSPPLWVQIVIVVLALSLPALFADELGLRDRPTPSSRLAEREQREEPARPDEQEPAPERSRALGVALTVLLGLLLVGLVAGVSWLFWPEPRRDRSSPGVEVDAVLEELAAGIDDLAVMEDPRRAVLACYARMERLLAAVGIPPRASDTPLELLARVLTEQRAARASVARLTELFERARFSPHDIDERMRQDALEALREVHDEVGASV